MSSLSSTLNHKTTPRISSRLPLAAGVIFVLWMAYTVTEALFQMNRLHPVTATILEFIPGLCGIGLLLLAGLSPQDCFLQRAPISKAGLAVLFLLTPLFIPVLLSATFAGWRPANALILNPLSAISQELFFRCALLPALLILLRAMVYCPLLSDPIMRATRMTVRADMTVCMTCPLMRTRLPLADPFMTLDRSSDRERLHPTEPNKGGYYK